eukprot:symbB.v1.2.010383.t1/scaffold638.1/size177989/2
MACNVAKLNIEDDMASLVRSLKNRSSQLLSVLRMERAKASDRPIGGEDEFDIEELRQLNHDFQTQKKTLQSKMDELEKKLGSCRTELARVKRELTVCDQQDAALTETARNLEARKDQVGDSAADKRILETKLHDISHFKSSNQRKRLQLLNDRDETERQLLHLTQALTVAVNQQQQFESRTRMIRSLHGDSGSKTGTIDEKGLKVANDKRRELAATEPMQLAGSGRFDGLHEIVEMSDGALQDVSSSLKEAPERFVSDLDVRLKVRPFSLLEHFVCMQDRKCLIHSLKCIHCKVQSLRFHSYSQPVFVQVRAAAHGDGDVLEEVLEGNLEIRKEINALIQERRIRAECGAYNDKGCFRLRILGDLKFLQMIVQVQRLRSKAYCNSSKRQLVPSNGRSFKEIAALRVSKVGCVENLKIQRGQRLLLP